MNKMSWLDINLPKKTGPSFLRTTANKFIKKTFAWRLKLLGKFLAPFRKSEIVPFSLLIMLLGIWGLSVMGDPSQFVFHKFKLKLAPGRHIDSSRNFSRSGLMFNRMDEPRLDIFAVYGSSRKRLVRRSEAQFFEVQISQVTIF